jgi:hypothetical protein
MTPIAELVALSAAISALPELSYAACLWWMSAHPLGVV